MTATTTSRMTEINAQIQAQKDLIAAQKAQLDAAQSQLWQMEKEKMDVYLSEPVALQRHVAYKVQLASVGLVCIYAHELPDTAYIEVGAGDEQIEPFTRDELKEAWERHDAFVRGNRKKSTGIYCDGHPEEPATRLWVVLYHGGGCVVLSQEYDKQGTDMFATLVTRHIEKVAIAYEITIEDGLM